MIHLLYGENIAKSAIRLLELEEKYKFQGLQKREIDAAKIDKADWDQFLGEESLFNESFLVIHNFFGNKNLDVSSLSKILDTAIFYEKKKLYALPEVQGLFVEKFDLEPVMFRLVESLLPGNGSSCAMLLGKVLSDQPPEVVMSMLARQFRLLLLHKTTSKEGPTDWQQLSTWQKGKLDSQSQSFTGTRLKELLSNLLRIDYENKTGGSAVNLSMRLEILLLTL